MNACPGANIDNMIGTAYGVLVVLHHQYGITHVAQVSQRGQEALVIPLVQSDRGLVEYVHNPDQARADLGGESDTLCFAAREGIGAAIKGQVVKPDIYQEAVSGAQFFQNLVSDFTAASIELHLVEVVLCFPHRQRGDAGQVDSLKEDVTCILSEPGALAVGARLGGEKLGQILTNGLRICIAVATLHIGQDALEGVVALEHIPPVVDIGKGNFLPAAAVQNNLTVFLVEFFIGGINIETVMFCERRQHMKIIDITPVPAAYSAFRQTGLRMQHNTILIEVLLDAEAIAAAAGTGWIIE